MIDLAVLLIRAIEQYRDAINGESDLFVGRVPFHVDLDVNVTMCQVQVSVHPCAVESEH